MASISRTKDRYTVQVLFGGKRHSIRLGRVNDDVAESFKARIERMVACLHLNTPFDEGLDKWLQGISGRARKVIDRMLSMTEHNPPQRPPKPSPDFPLTAHPNGRWCKKIGGKIHYFGHWRDPAKALAEYMAHKSGENGSAKKRYRRRMTPRDLLDAVAKAARRGTISVSQLVDVILEDVPRQTWSIAG